MPARYSPGDRGTIYVTSTPWKLRLVSIVSWLPAIICAWLVCRAPREEWAGAPLGGIAWWMLPALLLGLSLLLPAGLIPLHGRYVTRIVLERDGRLRVTTFLVWGQRTERLWREEVAPRRFRLDRAGEAPLGFEVLGALGFREPD
jgi:hypothetical protein